MSLKSKRSQIKQMAARSNAGSTFPGFLEFFFFWNVPSQLGVSSLNQGHGSTESIPKYYTPHFTSKDLPFKLKDHLRAKFYQF